MPARFLPDTSERLSGVGPLVREGVVPVVVPDEALDASGQRGDGTEVAPPEQTPAENAEPDFDLVHPAPVLGREMHHVLVRRVGQESTPLGPGTQRRPLVPDAG